MSINTLHHDALMLFHISASNCHLTVQLIVMGNQPFDRVTLAVQEFFICSHRKKTKKFFRSHFTKRYTMEIFTAVRICKDCPIWCYTFIKNDVEVRKLRAKLQRKYMEQSTSTAVQWKEKKCDCSQIMAGEFRRSTKTYASNIGKLVVYNISLRAINNNYRAQHLISLTVLILLREIRSGHLASDNFCYGPSAALYRYHILTFPLSNDHN